MRIQYPFVNPLFALFFNGAIFAIANAANTGKKDSGKNAGAGMSDADKINQELGGSMVSNKSTSNSSSPSANSAKSSSSSTTQTQIIGGKGNKKKVVTKTVVTEVEEEETEEEKRQKAARKHQQQEQNNSFVQFRSSLFDNNWRDLLANEAADREEYQRNQEAQFGRLNELGANILDTKNGHLGLRSNATDPFAACIDELPAKTCAILKPFCAVSDTARAIRFLRERSDYILYLDEDLQKHINFVKSTASENVDASYLATLLQNLENIKSLLPSVTKTAPLIQMILDEDSEEELERLLDAHFHFKQECERHRGTCKRMDIASVEREKSCHIYEQQCCCDGLKFQDFYKRIQNGNSGKHCDKAKAMGESVRRLVEATCAKTCESCPTRFKLNEYADELVECERDKKLPKLAELHAHVHPKVQIPMPIMSESPATVNIAEYPELMDQLQHPMLHPKRSFSPTLDIQMQNLQLPSVPLNLQSTAIRHSQPNVNLLAQIINKQTATKPSKSSADNKSLGQIPSLVNINLDSKSQMMGDEGEQQNSNNNNNNGANELMMFI